MQSKLWARFRDRLCSAKFRRQHAIGPFIAGFCCVERGLVVELDGGQHLKQAKKDQRRTALIERRGYRVLRVWDNEVLKIWRLCWSKSPPLLTTLTLTLTLEGRG